MKLHELTLEDLPVGTRHYRGEDHNSIEVKELKNWAIAIVKELRGSLNHRDEGSIEMFGCFLHQTDYENQDIDIAIKIIKGMFNLKEEDL